MRGKMTRVEELRWGIEALVNGDAGDKVRRIVKQLIAAAREEGYREGCIEKDAEWRRGYNQGWEERKAFDQPGGALPTVLAPKENEQDNTTEEEYEDMRRNGGPEVKP